MNMVRDLELMAAAVQTMEPYDREPINEDLVRQGLIDAIALAHKVSMSNWLELNQTAKMIFIHVEQRLNAELKALLVGDLSYYKQ